MKKLVDRVVTIEHHRNGISGVPFSAVLFKMREGRGERNMLGIVFDTEDCAVAVLDVDMAAAGNIRFGENSWRGDDFADELRPLVKAALGD